MEGPLIPHSLHWELVFQLERFDLNIKIWLQISAWQKDIMLPIVLCLHYSGLQNHEPFFDFLHTQGGAWREFSMVCCIFVFYTK